jgi:hypothetical protein
MGGTMRGARLYLVGITAAASVLASGLWIGCGSSTTENNGTPADSGIDALQDTAPPPQDTGVDAPTDAGCLADVDLNTIQIPDADINDAGANTDLCVGCVRSNCPAEVTACNADCICKTDLIDLFDCVAEAGAGNSGSFQGCALSSFAGGGQAEQLLALEFYACASKNCLVQCGLPPQDAGVDAGADAEADAQADGASDGATE